MGLELRTGRNGKLRPIWYGRYELNGKRFTLNLGVKVRGTPPASLRDKGDLAFEQSRTRAQAKLDHAIEQARRKHDTAHLVERLYEIKTGEQIQSVELEKLPEAWATIPRRRPPNERYARQCKSTLTRFVTFVRDQNPKAQDIAHVTRLLARAFMDAEEARGVTAKTWNDTLKLLRATFKHLMPAGAVNPFFGIPTRDTETVFRHPFTPDELNDILFAAHDDDFIRPIIVTAMCTAMRRGDCCLLKWKDVDLGQKYLTVKTNKTGQTVSIPIFPRLYDELKGRKASGTYVFPEQAAMYKENPDGITWRVRKLFAAAGFKDETGDDKDVVRGKVHADREGGLRRASVRDFHSFRVTWVTIALTAGVPLELVQKVTGHKTAEIVLKHYYQPNREDFGKALQGIMPNLLSPGYVPDASNPDEAAGAPSPSTALIYDAIRAIEGMRAKNWKVKRDEALTILQQATGRIDDAWLANKHRGK